MRNTQNQRGVTLVELVLVLVVIGIFSTLYMTSTDQIWRSVVSGKNIGDGNSYAQACMDHVLARRRNPTYGYTSIATSVPSTICDTLPTPPAGLTRTVNVNNAATDPLCLGGDCKSVNVLIKSGATTVANVWMFLIP